MIPRYPFSVTIEFHQALGRKQVEKHVDTLPMAMAIFDENIGRRDVYRVTIRLIVHQAEGKGYR